jgi:hypothetical protein
MPFLLTYMLNIGTRAGPERLAAKTCLRVARTQVDAVFLIERCAAIIAAEVKSASDDLAAKFGVVGAGV